MIDHRVYQRGYSATGSRWHLDKLENRCAHNRWWSIHLLHVCTMMINRSR